MVGVLPRPVPVRDLLLNWRLRVPSQALLQAVTGLWWQGCDTIASCMDMGWVSSTLPFGHLVAGLSWGWDGEARQ